MRSILKNKNKRANVLTENIIFIILNLVFLSILMLFVFSKTGGAAILEEKYSKQIALIIDSAEPVMAISLDMEDVVKTARDNGIGPNDAVSITDNIVTVKLRDKGSYSYSFFNDVNPTIKFDSRKGTYEIFIE